MQRSTEPKYRINLIRSKRDDTVTFRVSEEIGHWLHDRARGIGISRSKLCFSVIEEYLKKQMGTRTRDVYDPGAVAQIKDDLQAAIEHIGLALKITERLRRIA